LQYCVRKKSCASNRDRGASMNAKLAEKRGYVNLNRTFSEIEGACYLLVGSALHNQAQNVALPPGQQFKDRREGFGCRKAGLLAASSFETGLPVRR
jgi:hypothetical protein